MSHPLNFPQLALDYHLESEQLSLKSRKWIAQEFHDSVAQTLSSLMMFINFIDAAQTANKDTDWAFKKLSQLCDQLRSNFEYSTNEQLSLSENIHEMLKELDDDVTWIAQIPGEHLHLTPRLQHELCNVVREGIHNIVKHADAGFVFLSLCEVGDYIELKLNDDGKGFDQAQIRAGGIGLKGILERARAMGGHCTIESQPGNGTTLNVYMRSSNLDEQNAATLRTICQEISISLKNKFVEELAQLEECICQLRTNPFDEACLQRAKALVAHMTDGVRSLIYSLRGAPVSPIALDFLSAPSRGANFLRG